MMKRMGKGFSSQKQDGQQRMEILYWLNKTGDIWVSNPSPVSPYFDMPDRIWTQVEQMPHDAEFIGDYLRPVNITA